MNLEIMIEHTKSSQRRFEKGLWESIRIIDVPEYTWKEAIKYTLFAAQFHC